MGTQSTTTKPKVCLDPITDAGKMFDKFMAGQRLVLAAFRMEEAKRPTPCSQATPQELILWQAWLALFDGCEELCRRAGYDLQDAEPE